MGFIIEPTNDVRYGKAETILIMTNYLGGKDRPSIRTLHYITYINI